MSELEQYAGADGWAAMLKHEWQIPQFPFINAKRCVATGAQYAWSDAFARLAMGMLNHKTHNAYA